MPPLPALSEAQNRFDAHIGQTLASTATNIEIRPFSDEASTDASSSAPLRCPTTASSTLTVAMTT
jgi:hypothetical protein